MPDTQEKLRQFRLKYPGVLSDPCLTAEYYAILREVPYIPTEWCRNKQKQTKKN